MPGGAATTLGPFTGGLHNASGRGEAIQDNECYVLTNLMVDADDGTLVNRPAITPVAGAVVSTGSYILGTYYPPNEEPLLMVSDGSYVRGFSLNSGTALVGIAISGVRAGVQFQDRFYIAPGKVSGTGGYFWMSAPAVITWVTVAAIPRGDAMVAYQYRLFVADGDQGANTDGRIYWTAATDGTKWDTPSDGGSAGIAVGDGQRIKAMCVLNNDLVLFKERSTYRFTFISGGPLSAVVSKISNVIGCAGYASMAVYDNNSVYVIHNGEVWQLYNYNFTKISHNIKLRNTLGVNSTNPDFYQCASIFKNMLYIRYYADLYSYNIEAKTWALIDTVNDFDRVVATKMLGTNPEKAYMTANGTRTGMYWMQDDHYTNVGTNPGETFTCTMRTKIFDFNTPWQYKVLFWWGLNIAASGTVTTSMTIPNATNSTKWKDVAPRTWADAAAFKWGQRVSSIFPAQGVGSTGTYGRRIIKNLGKLRFRQVYWMVSVLSNPNTGTDASVRIYSIVPVMKAKETVVAQTT